jgi:hypothetical protein
MDFELKDLLEALGPNAALIFAAWIFLSFLQQRYSDAYDRYRQLIDAYRQGEPDTPHMRSVRGQVKLYRKRCEQMRAATNIGIWSAILIIASLLAAGLAVIFGDNAVFKVVGAGGSMLGLVGVIVAATFVLKENDTIEQVIQDEPSDVPELAREMGDKVQARHRRGQEAAGG